MSSTCITSDGEFTIFKVEAQHLHAPRPGVSDRWFSPNVAVMTPLFPWSSTPDKERPAIVQMSAQDNCYGNSSSFVTAEEATQLLLFMRQFAKAADAEHGHRLRIREVHLTQTSRVILQTP